jgi:putative endonuclease
MKYHFYIIYSASSNRYYIGHTSEIAERVRKHNSNHKGFTGKANDWQVAYTEEFETKEEAYARERQVKSWKSRKMIERLIGNAGGV